MDDYQVCGLQYLRKFEQIPMNIDQCIADLLEAKCLHEKDLRLLCQKAKEIFLQQSNVQPVSSPVTVCGDVHGQFYDVLELFRTGGEIDKTCYIFIGDFVDRGYHSVQTFEYLLCLKVKYPERITLLRGNHESRQITTVYGFYDQINRKYGNANPWKYCTQVFDYLPIGAVIDGKVFCVHGGLSPQIKTIDQVRTIDRRIEIPHQGPFCDLMWSDPQDIEDWAINARGAGWVFGSKVTNDFCHINGLQLIARAHQLVQQGYIHWFKDKNLVTVWSAPNYCYRCNNLAAIMQVKQSGQQQFKIFKTVPQSMKSVHFKNVLPYFL